MQCSAVQYRHTGCLFLRTVGGNDAQRSALDSALFIPWIPAETHMDGRPIPSLGLGGGAAMAFTLPRLQGSIVPPAVFAPGAMFRSMHWVCQVRSKARVAG